MSDNTVVIKLSGKALGATDELGALFEACRGQRAVFVHGGGIEVDSLFEALHLEVVKSHGLRVSPKEHMPYICAALGGMCNKNLQSQALKHGLNALGMIASDGRMLKVEKLSEELGMVGRVSPCDASYVSLLLDHGYTPVIASLAFDENGDLFNVNADDVACAVAALIGAPLYFISDVPGVLDKNGTIIPSLDSQKVAALIADGTISGGMEVKVKSALEASQAIKKNVYIASYKDPHLTEILSSRRSLGTTFSF